MNFTGFKDFKDEIVKRISDIYPDSAVELKDVPVCNRGILAGLSIKENQSAVPGIYLDDYFAVYQGGRDIYEIVGEICILYEEFMQKDHADYSFIASFDESRKYLKMRVINTGRNKEFLMIVPNIGFLDLSVIFYLDLESAGNNASIINVTHQMFSVWGKSIEDVQKEAVSNMGQNDPFIIKDMRSVMLDIFAAGSGKKAKVEELRKSFLVSLKRMGSKTAFMLPQTKGNT